MRALSEKEKMLAGLEFCCMDKELLQDREHARRLVDQFNRCQNKETKEEIIHTLFKKVGNSCTIEAPLHCDYGYNVVIGDHFYANYNLCILDGNQVTIGDYVMMGPNVSLFTPNHPLDKEKRRKQMEVDLPIKIGNDVWIGGNVVILAGVTIGNNVVIGAGSVVTKDIPDNVVAVGNPCRIIKKID